MQLPKRYKPQTNTTKLGKACPLSFQLSEIGYRCAEATGTTSFIGDNPTFAECYAYCYHYGGVAPPYYFEYALSPTGAKCGCVGETCTLVAAPGSFVLETLPGGVVPPVPEPPGPYPPVFEDTVEEMNSALIPPPGVWCVTRVRMVSIVPYVPLPSPGANTRCTAHTPPQERPLRRHHCEHEAGDHADHGRCCHHGGDGHLSDPPRADEW